MSGPSQTIATDGSASEPLSPWCAGPASRISATARTAVLPPPRTDCHVMPRENRTEEALCALVHALNDSAFSMNKRNRPNCIGASGRRVASLTCPGRESLGLRSVTVSTALEIRCLRPNTGLPSCRSSSLQSGTTSALENVTAQCGSEIDSTPKRIPSFHSLPRILLGMPAT